MAEIWRYRKNEKLERVWKVMKEKEKEKERKGKKRKVERIIVTTINHLQYLRSSNKVSIQMKGM